MLPLTGLNDTRAALLPGMMAPRGRVSRSSRLASPRTVHRYPS
jgi:hypothetical protein